MSSHDGINPAPASRFTISLGDRVFPSKAAAKKAIGALLRELPLGEVDLEYAPMLVALLRRHPKWRQKEGVGLAGFEVRRNCQFGHHEFWLIRANGSATDFSYLECLSPYNDRAKLAAAFRQEVAYQTQGFFSESFSPGMTCPVTGEEMIRGEVEVDHLPPTFAEILRSFIELRGLVIGEIGYLEGDGQTTAMLIDRKLADDWRTFHRERAKYRLLSRSGHRQVTRDALARTA